MKIAVYHNLPSGGAKRAVYETLRRLAQKHTIDIFTTRSADLAFCDLRPFANKYQIYDFQASRLFHSPFGRLNQLLRWRDLGRIEQLCHKIAGDIDRGGYDVCYIHPCMWTQAPAVIQFLRTPSVYHMHEPNRGLYEPEIARPYEKSQLRSKLDRFDPLIGLYRGKLRQVDADNTRRAAVLLSNSKFTAANILRIYQKTAQVAYFGIDTTTFVPLGLPRENFVLSVGALRPNKGFDFLIQALGQIPAERRPPLRLVGNTDHPDEHPFLQGLADQAGVELTIETMVPETELVRRYSQAALFAYAPNLEPFGLAPLEALACGTPVVSVAEGGMLETIQDGQNGLLVQREPVKFARAIQSLIEDPARRDELGAAGARYVKETWGWEKAVQGIENYLISASTPGVGGNIVRTDTNR